MDNKILMKIMELSDDTERLINISFREVERQCDTLGRYDRDGDVNNAIREAIQKQRTLRQLLRDMIIADSLSNKENQDV
jgi:hypothetical protein